MRYIVTLNDNAGTGPEGKSEVLESRDAGLLSFTKLILALTEGEKWFNATIVRVNDVELSAIVKHHGGSDAIDLKLL